MAEKKIEKVRIDTLSLRELLEYEHAVKIFMERYAFVGRPMSNASANDIKQYRHYTDIYNKIITRINEMIDSLE